MGLSIPFTFDSIGKSSSAPRNTKQISMNNLRSHRVAEAAQSIRRSNHRRAYGSYKYGSYKVLSKVLSLSLKDVLDVFFLFFSIMKLSNFVPSSIKSHLSVAYLGHGYERG